MRSRMELVEIRGGARQSFCAAVDEGLCSSPKTLPTHYLYDRHGSELFERITELPEYYLTRCEADIFERHAADIVEAARPTSVIEFGSGSSKKTRLLLDAAEGAGDLEWYVPIDISAEFLTETANRLIEEYPIMCVRAVVAEYFDAAAKLPHVPGPRLILFLGSNVGNLTHEEARRFLALLSKDMDPGDRILMGVDLVKDPSIIEQAYNDSAGVTAEFNLNLLRRINRELDGGFDLARFRHEAPYLEAEERVEMRLVSVGGQTVPIEAIGRSFDFVDGEAIHTEWSHKYSLESVGRLAGEAGLRVCRHWTDTREWFATVLLERA